MSKSCNHWPLQSSQCTNCPSDEEIRHVNVNVSVELKLACAVPLDRYSSFEHLQRVIAWIVRFVNNCQPQRFKNISNSYLTIPELLFAETYLCLIVQSDHFSTELDIIKSDRHLPKGNCLLSLSPFIDTNRLLRVGGHQKHSKLSYSRMHPVILHAKHPIARLLIRSEHKRLLHGGPILFMSSLCHRYHILRVRQTVRAITHECTVCRHWSVRPKPQALGQLPIERLTPCFVFDKTGIDYAGPIYIKYGHVRKPIIVKTYVCVFVSLSVKAIHLELVSDLTSEAFIACLRRFVSRRGCPSLL